MDAAGSLEVLDLPITVDRREALRYLGYPRSKGPSLRVLHRIEQLERQVPSLVRGKGAFLLTDRSAGLAVGMPQPSERVALGVCTIGPALEQMEAQLSEGDPLGALILDAFGSAAAEEAAEVLHARICAAVQVEGLKAGRRVSPGYGKWGVSSQFDLLARLPLDQVGVRLTESAMMLPRKSISFAIALGAPTEIKSRRRCHDCELVTCPYRREEGAQSPTETESS